MSAKRFYFIRCALLADTAPDSVQCLIQCQMGVTAKRMECALKGQ